ncbi:MAG: DedA family protein [Planctomycetales bacterium]|nr:DedA family protein [Planctomycetales bacterium]MCA9168305.1 DedA family protein [Planctomycetales bacterium]
MNTAIDTVTDKKPNPIRRLYNWVLHWADTPYGPAALFGISFAESSFFPVPPDVLQIALSAGQPRKSFRFAAISSAGSLLGGIVGWAIGYALWHAVGDFFYSHVPGVTPDRVETVGRLYEAHAFWSILAAAFTPIPYKVFTISAGIFHDYVSLGTLIVASAIGRSARFFMVACCLYFFGPKVREQLEKRLELATVVFALLVLLGFWVVKTVL